MENVFENKFFRIETSDGSEIGQGNLRVTYKPGKKVVYLEPKGASLVLTGAHHDQFKLFTVFLGSHYLNLQIFSRPRPNMARL